MNKERILPHKVSQKLSAEEIEGVSASGTTVATTSATYNNHSGADVYADLTVDM